MHETTQAEAPQSVDPQGLETAVDEAIRVAGGSQRAAIRGLILGQLSYEDEIARTVSAGYVRRKLRVIP